jgi:hypothetical protein
MDANEKSGMVIYAGSLSREPGLSAEDITPAMDNEDEVHDA